jgi:membrane-associated phospholipid phosphatase
MMAMEDPGDDQLPGDQEADVTRPDVPSRHERLLWTLGQGALVGFLVFCYFRVRHLTEGARDVAVAHGRDLVSLERHLGIDVEGATQRLFTRSGLVETLANWVYIYGHWPVIIATMSWLAWRHRDVFLRLRDAMVISGALGMVVFVTYPVAPPRLLHLGLVDTVAEHSSAYRVLQPPAFTDQYAAMPSLHAGWDLLVGIAIVTAAGSVALRIVGIVLPVLMMTAVVATANHYVIDVVAGVALVLFGQLVALRIDRRRQKQSADAETPLDEAENLSPVHAAGG